MQNEKVIYEASYLSNKAILICEDAAIALAGVIALIFDEETCLPEVGRGLTPDEMTRFLDQPKERLPTMKAMPGVPPPMGRP